MVHNLHDADLLTAVYNRTPSKTDPFVEQGIPAAPPPAALAEQVEVVFVMVTADEALHAVLEGPQGILEGLPPDAVVVNTSTVSVEATEAVGTPVVHCGSVGARTKTKLFTNLLLGNLLLKDLNLIAEAAEQRDVYLPQTAATREAVNGAKALGHGGEDMMAVIKLLESIAGTQVGNDAD